MSLTKANLKERVRRSVGNPKSSQPEELSDTSIDDELEAALRALDKYVPDWRLYSLTTQDDQQTYAVTAGVTQVLQVYWFGTSVISEIFGEEFDVLFGIPLYDVETGFYKQCVDYLEKEQARARFDWDFNPGEGKIYLIPEPEESNKSVYYIGAKPWTWSTVPVGREDVIVRYASSQCLKILGRTRSRLSGVQRAGGLIDYGAVDAFVRDGREEEAAVLAELQAESQRWMALL